MIFTQIEAGRLVVVVDANDMQSVTAGHFQNIEPLCSHIPDQPLDHLPQKRISR